MSAVPEWFAGKARWSGFEIAFWCALAGAYFLPNIDIALLSQIFIWGLFAMSLDLLLGYRGIASLGHAAFFGAGAYCAGFLGKYGWGEPVSGLLISMLPAAALGWLTGKLVQRVSGVALLMVTLGLNLILFDFVQRSTALTGGDDGLQGIVVDPLLGLFRFDIFGRTAYWYSLGALFALFVFLRAFVHSPFGLALTGSRENARRMIMLGSPVEGDISIVFAVSAAAAAAAGALLTQTTQFVSPATLSFQRSADVLVMLIIGGAGRLYGGLIGALIFLVMKDWLAALSPVYWYFWIGLLLVLVVSFFRKGVLPSLETGMRGLIARLGKARGGGPPA